MTYGEESAHNETNLFNTEDCTLETKDKSSRVVEDESYVDKNALENGDDLSEETSNELDVDLSTGSNIDAGTYKNERHCLAST